MSLAPVEMNQMGTCITFHGSIGTATDSENLGTLEESEPARALVDYGHCQRHGQLQLCYQVPLR